MNDWSGVVVILWGFLMFPAPLAWLYITGDYSLPDEIKPRTDEREGK